MSSKNRITALPGGFARAYIDVLLEFANQADDSAGQAAVLFSRATLFNPSARNASEEITERMAQQIGGDERWYAKLRRQVRKMLQDVLRSPERPDDLIRDWVNMHLNYRDVPAHFSLGANGFLEPFLMPNSTEGKLAVGIAALFATRASRRLRQCEVCSRYFVIYEARRHNKRYCSPECTVTGQSEKSAERVRAYRERQRKKRKTKRRSK